MKKSNKREILPKNKTSAEKTNDKLVKPTIVLQKGKILNNKTKVIYFVTQHDQKNINKRKIEYGTSFFKNGRSTIHKWFFQLLAPFNFRM